MMWYTTNPLSIVHDSGVAVVLRMVVPKDTSH